MVGKEASPLEAGKLLPYPSRASSDRLAVSR
jgi:hypothetical protein